MKPREYALLEMAIEDGVAIGIGRAYKHDDAPSTDALLDQIRTSVLTSICEWFHFEDAPE